MSFLIHDSADKVPPRPAEPPHRTISGADFPTAPRARLEWPWHVSVVLGVLALIALGLLVWWLYRLVRAWATANPVWADIAVWCIVTLLAVLVIAAVAYVLTRGYLSLAERYGWTLDAFIVRSRVGTAMPKLMVVNQSASVFRALETEANQRDIKIAHHAPTPLLSTNSRGDSSTAGDTLINGVGEELTPALSPPLVTLDSFPPSESATAVPLGMDGADPVRLDFGKDTLHVGLYGASGAGKDNLLRAWFMSLTRRNTPDQVCFAVLDGKGDWLTADLRDLAHMWMPPAGGAGQQGTARMKAGIERIEAEMVRRLDLVNGAGCRDRETYMQRTGQTLPLLIVFITDGVTAVEGALTGLMNDLVSKARAVGIRVVVSMQTPTGQDMRWRLNLSTYISGHLPHPSQDLVAMGLTKAELVDGLRPSQLPTPQQEPGLFIVRQGEMVKKVKAVYVNDEAFDGYVARLARRAAPLPADTRSPRQRWLDETRATLEHQPRDVRMRAAERFARQGLGQREIAYACKLSDEAAGAIFRSAAVGNGGSVAPSAVSAGSASEARIDPL